MIECPYCAERPHLYNDRQRMLGLVRAEICVVGALLQHESCKQVLIVTKASAPCVLELRVATEEEKRC